MRSIEREKRKQKGKDKNRRGKKQIKTRNIVSFIQTKKLADYILRIE